MDIKLTLSKSQTRSPTIVAEARWVEDNAPISYGLPTRPTKADRGDTIYFVKEGAMRARAKIDELVSAKELGPRFTYSGLEVSPAPWNVLISAMELSSQPVPAKGFQGYRYVDGPEARRYVAAFSKRQHGNRLRLSAYEGVLRRISIDVPQRDRSLRTACLEHYGAVCAGCRFDFSEVYGEIATGFMHVHHVKPLGAGSQRVTHAIRDLRPVCPNCHAVMHLSDPPLSVSEIRARVLKQRTQG